MPAPRDTYVNPLLTNVYLTYGGKQNYIASAIFPTLTVQKETGIYFVADKENLRAPANAYRGEFARANRVTNTLTQATYSLEEKTLEHAISERVMKQYQDPFDAKKNGIKLITDKLKIDNELDAQATILASGAPGLAASTSWGTVSTDIAGQIRTGRNSIQQNTGQKANTVILGKPSLDALMKNTAFLASIQYVSIVTEANLRNAIAGYFDVENVYIGDAIYNAAKEGQADSMSYIWGNSAILAYTNTSAAIDDTSAGYKLQVSDLAYSDEWYEQDKKLTLVRTTDFYDNKIIDPACLYVITGTV